MFLLGQDRLDVAPVITLVFAIALGISLGVGSLLAFHTYLLSKNMSTLEFYRNHFERGDGRSGTGRHMTPQDLYRGMLRGRGLSHPYDQGSFKRNFEEVFGRDLPWYVAVLPLARPAPPMSDASLKMEEVMERWNVDAGGDDPIAPIASMI